MSSPSRRPFALTNVANRTLIPVLRSRAVGMAERKTWWRNFTEARPLQLRLAGKDYGTTARGVREGVLVSVVADVDVSRDGCIAVAQREIA